MKNKSGGASKQKEWKPIDQDLLSTLDTGVWQFKFHGERVEFSLQSPDGSPIQCHRSLHQANAPRCLTKKAFREKFPEMSKNELKAAWGAVLGNRRDDKIVRLMKQLNIIANTPEHFVSLTVDRTQRPYKSIKEENEIFNKFKHNLMRRHPYSWFIYKKEYEIVPKIHFHMIGTLYSRRCARYSLFRTENLIKSLWDEANGFTWEDSTDVRAFKKGLHSGYVIASYKRKNDMRCVELLRGSSMFGLLGKKNVYFHEPRIADLIGIERIVFLQSVENYFREQGRLDWFRRQFRRSKGNFAFIPQNVQKEAWEKATGIAWGVVMKPKSIPQ